MYALVAQEWSPTTWALLFAATALTVLSVFVTFVLVLVHAARVTPPPRHPASGGETDVPSAEKPTTHGDVHHLHAA